jgi:uncharacterized membrane protein YphA (DoxX/SURF4 family)
MTTQIRRVSTIADRLTDRLTSPLIGSMRIVVGLLWLANLEWKRPPDFGLINKNGLYKYVDSAVRNPVFGPYSWFIENVVLKQYRLFGWITLLVEAVVAACLILGLFTRFAALVGALLSVSILLSVLYYDQQYEWPWSYYLMIAIHLLLVATLAGRHWGLDGVLRRDGDARRRAVLVLGAIAVVIGIIGIVVSADGSFTAKQGDLLGWSKGELKLLWFNPLSGIVTAVLGALALTGARLDRRPLTSIAAVGFALMTLQVVVQWRYNGGNWTGGVFGGTGANMAFWGMLAVGLATCLRRSSDSTATS